MLDLIEKTEQARTGQVVTGVVVNLTHKLACDNLVDIFAGEAPVDLSTITDDNGNMLFDPQHKPLLPKAEIENVLKAKGARFIVIDVRKNLASDMLAKHRETKDDNPFVDTKKAKAKRQAIEVYTAEHRVNCFWSKAIERAVERTDGTETGWKAKDSRSNRIANYRDSRVCCTKVNKPNVQRFYINYIEWKYLTERQIVDENGTALDTEWLAGFMKTTKAQKQQGREREAAKHGLQVQFDPQIRQMKMDNINAIRIFGKTYQPNG